jgi:hypothetical protein
MEKKEKEKKKRRKKIIRLNRKIEKSELKIKNLNCAVKNTYQWKWKHSNNRKRACNCCRVDTQ